MIKPKRTAESGTDRSSEHDDSMASTPMEMEVSAIDSIEGERESEDGSMSSRPIVNQGASTSQSGDMEESPKSPTKSKLTIITCV